MTHTLRFNTRAQFLAACEMLAAGADDHQHTVWGHKNKAAVREAVRQVGQQRDQVRRMTAREKQIFAGKKWRPR
jgi:hypothetical protein